jgi:hypothetical protein
MRGDTDPSPSSTREWVGLLGDVEISATDSQHGVCYGARDCDGASSASRASDTDLHSLIHW